MHYWFKLLAEDAKKLFSEQKIKPHEKQKKGNMI